MKYEEYSADYLSEALALLRAHSVNPLHDIDLLMDYLAFDYLVGNCDNHLKNFALDYADGRRHPVLAPRYDVLHCPRYEVDLDMGLPLSAERGVYRLDASGLRERCRKAGFSERRVLEKFVELYSALPDALAAAEGDLLAAGMEPQASLRMDVLEHAARIMKRLKI